MQHTVMPKAPCHQILNSTVMGRITKDGVYLYAQMPRSKWIEKCLGMVTLSGSAIWWTWETEDVFRRVRDGNKYAMKLCTILN